MLALIGGVGFYFLRKHQLNGTSPSAANLENGTQKDSSASTLNDSEQSLADDIKQPSKVDKPDVQVQAANTKKQQRPAANMAFNDDL